MGTIIEVVSPPAPHDGADLLAVWQELFPAAGRYWVEPLVKARVGEGSEASDPFENWFLQRLYEVTRGQAVDSQEAMWRVLDDMLMRHGIRAPSEIEHWKLQQVLFDLQGASAARLAGLRIPAEVVERLKGLGWEKPAMIDFPGVAYRIGRIGERLAEKVARIPTWNEVKKLASAVPLGPAEEAAVNHLRERAGLWLRPIYDDAGRVWTAEREITPLREILTAGRERRETVTNLARELGNSQRARGIFRDAERVVRTEIANARGQGAWDVQRGRFDADTLVFRNTSATPCKECLRLYRKPDGTPRLYRWQDVETWDSLPRGGVSKNESFPRIGAQHPRCVCSPYSVYHPAMDALFAKVAPYYASLMQLMKLTPSAETPAQQATGGIQ